MDPQSQKSSLLKEHKIVRGGHDQNIKTALRLIYDSSRQRMFHIADRMIRGKVGKGEMIKLVSSVKNPELPNEEVWNFKLGDPVKINLSRVVFKWMQKRTVGWSERLNLVYGRIGFVNKVTCEHDCNIGVYFPEEYAEATLYAGVLEKVDPPEYENLDPRWKVGDYVQIVGSLKTLKQLQRGLDQLPEKFIGSRGRVVAVTHPCILVTFDDMTTYDLKSASLVPWKGESDEVSKNVVEQNEFSVGKKVKVMSNVKKLIKNQEGHGGWDPAMCGMIGKSATIVGIQKDGSLDLRAEYCREWRLNPISVLSSGDKENKEEDLPFLPNDIVKVIVPRNIQEILALLKVPTVFLEFLRAVVILPYVDKDFNYYVRFNADQHVQIDKMLLRCATISEKQKYENIETEVKELKVGDKVHLDIGPPNYVKAMIQELDLDPVVAIAMVESATLIGFINFHMAVIEYENGQRFRVKKKFLTVPGKFNFNDWKDTISLDVICEICEAIKESVKGIHSSQNVPEEKWRVDTMKMSQGNPPYVKYKIESTVATFQAVFENLKQNTHWAIELLGGGQFVLNKVKVGITVNDESNIHISQGIIDTFDEAAPRKQQTGPIVTGNEADQPCVEVRPVGSVDRSPVNGGEEMPSDEPPPYVELEQPEVRHPVCDEEEIPADPPAAHADDGNPLEARGGAQRPAENPPEVYNVHHFRYMTLRDQALAQNVYFPYVVQDMVGAAAHPAASASDNQRWSQNIFNFRNDGDVNLKLRI